MYVTNREYEEFYCLICTQVSTVEDRIPYTLRHDQP